MGEAFSDALQSHRQRAVEEFAAAAAAAMEEMTAKADTFRAHVGETAQRTIEDFGANVEAIGQSYASVSAKTAEEVASQAVALRRKLRPGRE